MLIIPLIVVGFSMTVVNSGGPFNFRGSCYVTHLANTFSAKCDGASKLINTKDLLLDSRTTASMSEMDLINFQSVILDSSVQIQKIKINNTKNVSLYISNTKLKELLIESVDVLTLKQQISDDSIRMTVDRMVLNNVNRLQFINEGGDKFLWPIDNVEISNMNDFALDSLKLHIKSINASIKNTNIRFKSQSSLLLEAAFASISDNSVVYIHDEGYFSINVKNISVVESKIDLENGALQLLNSNNVMFSRNSLYGFENKSLLLHGYSNVKFENNDIFTSDIVNLLKLKQERLIFIDNNFGCTDCNMKNKLLSVDLKDTGDTNYCYTECKLTLNKYKELLNDYCVCNGEPTVEFSIMCAPCLLKSDVNFIETVEPDSNIFRYSLFAVLLLVLFISISCCIYKRDKVYKWKSLFVSDVLPQQLENEQSDSQVVIYRKPQNDDDDSDDNYETVDGRA